jgi:hypothetical protein
MADDDTVDDDIEVGPDDDEPENPPIRDDDDEPEPDDEPRDRDRPKDQQPGDRNADRDDDAADDQPTDDGKWEPPTQERWDRTVRALKRANKQSEMHRRRADELERKLETADQKTIRLANETALAKYKPIAAKGELKAALMAAGLRTVDDNGDPLDSEVLAKRLKRITRLVDFDQIDIDADGDVTGLDDQIDEIKADYPELFGRPAPKDPPKPKPRPGPRGGARADGADRRPEPDKPKTTAERIAAGLAGRNN